MLYSLLERQLLLLQFYSTVVWVFHDGCALAFR
jgi:hypothetical protein